jgi:hypothetical protein
MKDTNRLDSAAAVMDQQPLPTSDDSESRQLTFQNGISTGHSKNNFGASAYLLTEEAKGRNRKVVPSKEQQNRQNCEEGYPEILPSWLEALSVPL